MGQTIAIVGAASDPEDGTLSGTSLVWAAPFIGVIGTGTSVSVSGLPIGNHQVTLTATDANGRSAVTWRTVKIVP